MLTLTTERNVRVESVGEHVHLFRFRNADLTVTFSNWRAYVHICLHGTMADSGSREQDKPISRFDSDKFNYCPHCDSGKTIRPSDQNMSLRHCIDCGLR